MEVRAFYGGGGGLALVGCPLGLESVQRPHPRDEHRASPLSEEAVREKKAPLHGAQLSWPAASSAEAPLPHGSTHEELGAEEVLLRRHAETCELLLVDGAAKGGHYLSRRGRLGLLERGVRPRTSLRPLVAALACERLRRRRRRAVGRLLLRPRCPQARLRTLIGRLREDRRRGPLSHLCLHQARRQAELLGVPPQEERVEAPIALQPLRGEAEVAQQACGRGRVRGFRLRLAYRVHALRAGEALDGAQAQDKADDGPELRPGSLEAPEQLGVISSLPRGRPAHRAQAPGARVHKLHTLQAVAGQSPDTAEVARAALQNETCPRPGPIPDRRRQAVLRRALHQLARRGAAADSRPVRRAPGAILGRRPDLDALEPDEIEDHGALGNAVVAVTAREDGERRPVANQLLRSRDDLGLR
mmetsp:Transcript_17211/g.51546  ORF Transcript_17211/g.51546 Transcript_17211/m.51546 type:complete len:416 (+) Transcript_17211:1661-2908(+)